MERVFVLLSLLVWAVAPLSAIPITTVGARTLRTVTVESGELDVDASPYGIAPVGLFVSGRNGRIYIDNYPANRLNVYDSRTMGLVAYLKFPAEPQQWIGLDYYLVDDHGNVIGLIGKESIAKFDPTGRQVYNIRPGRPTTDLFDVHTFEAYGEFFVCYDDSGKLFMIDGIGHVLDDQKVESIRQQSIDQSTIVDHLPNKSQMTDFLDQNHVLMINDVPLVKSDEVFDQYLQLLNPSIRETTIGDVDLNSSDDLFAYWQHDRHGNMYCSLLSKDYQKRICHVIISREGQILCAFNFDTSIRVAQTVQDYLTGNILWTVFSKVPDLRYTFSLVDNTWDPSEAASAPPPTSAMISTLSASSTQTEPTDKNAYHPVKLFDGDPKTMWIENAKGPGIGESVTVGFDQPVTVDEIQFMPGCFWPEYWKQNYRVKQLEVKLDDKVLTANFTDQMVVQSLKLPSAVTFTRAVFTIKDVYPTTKWEDTAISEIAFYNQGAKIDVDYSKFKDFLKKAP